MANWQNVIDLSRCWKEAEDKPELTIEICKDAIFGLKNMKVLPEDMEVYREELIDKFQYLIENNMDDFSAFNEILNDLYDFADTPLESGWNGKKLAWVKTLI